MTYTPDSPLIGPSHATAAQCAAYILARPHGEYDEHDIAEVIVPGYVRVCERVGLDWTLLIAQMCHETAYLSSWWSQRPRRNPAGIGVTGYSTNPRHLVPAGPGWVYRGNTLVEGCAFASWTDDAIPCHAGRLLAYALTDADIAPFPTGRDPELHQAQRSLIAQALAVRPLPPSYRGVAPSLRGLAGRWAVPGATYPDKIVTIANAIVRVRA